MTTSIIWSILKGERNKGLLIPSGADLTLDRILKEGINAATEQRQGPPHEPYMENVWVNGNRKGRLGQQAYTAESPRVTATDQNGHNRWGLSTLPHRSKSECVEQEVEMLRRRDDTGRNAPARKRPTITKDGARKPEGACRVG